MDSLKNEISKSLTKILMEGDIVEKAIQDTLKSKMDSIVDNVLSYGSEPRKLIENKIEQGLVSFLSKKDFNKNVVCLETMFDQLLQDMNTDSLNIVKKFKSFTCYKAPKKITIGEIFEMYEDFIKENIEIDEDDFSDEDYEVKISFELDGMSEENENRKWSSWTYYAIRFKNDYDESLNRDLIIFTWDDMKFKSEKDVDFLIDGGFKADVKISELKELDDMEIKLLSMKNNYTSIQLDKTQDSEYIYIERGY